MIIQKLSKKMFILESFFFSLLIMCPINIPPPHKWYSHLWMALSRDTIDPPRMPTSNFKAYYFGDSRHFNDFFVVILPNWLEFARLTIWVGCGVDVMQFSVHRGSLPVFFFERRI